MNLLDVPFDSIDEVLIQRLFDNQIQESKTLDFKREINISSSEAKKELLADITAFANTDGGIIIFGIEEKKNDKGENTGLPGKVASLNIGNPDKFLQSIDDLIRNGTDPKLSAVQAKVVTYNNEQLLILGIRKFIGLPFMVTLNSTNKFYRRRNTGKYLVDVNELSDVFLNNYKMKERAEQFRQTRVKTVRNLEFIPNLVKGGAFFLHILPLGYLNDNQIDLGDTQTSEYLRKQFSPLGNDGYSHRHNLDGYLTYTEVNRSVVAYAQLFRNGAIEHYTSYLHRQTGVENTYEMNGYLLEESSIRIIKESFTVLEHLQVEPPYLVFVSTFDMKGVKIGGPRLWDQKSPDRDEIFLPSVLFNSRTEPIETKMKGVFDIFWQSANFSKSPYYNEKGERTNPKR